MVDVQLSSLSISSSLLPWFTQKHITQEPDRLTEIRCVPTNTGKQSCVQLKWQLFWTAAAVNRALDNGSTFASKFDLLGAKEA